MFCDVCGVSVIQYVVINIDFFFKLQIVSITVNFVFHLKHFYC